MEKNLKYSGNSLYVAKMLKVIKLMAFLMLIPLNGALASDSYSQETRLTLKVDEITLEDFLTKIEEQSEFRFFYSGKVDVKKKVSGDYKNKKIYDILDDIKDEADINYEVLGRQIILSPRSEASDLRAYQQTKNITGVVKDENGDPVPGVTVLVAGTGEGTITGIDGSYSLTNVPEGATLQFSFIGMTTQDVVVGTQSVINVTMVSELVGLNEVVVTALGIKREQKALGYATQKVEGKSLQEVRGVDVATSLTGKVAGLNISNSTDFNVAPTISLRGEEPLLVIDGIAYANKTLNDIAAEDILSMDVLKGATASALYGYRAANGAIMITTKNGSTGKMGVSVDLTSNTMFHAGFLAIPEKQSVYGRGYNGNYDQNRTYSWGPVMDGTVRTQWDPYLMESRDYEYLPIGKDNFKNFLEPAYITNNNVNVGFKTDKIALRSSLNWTEQKGVYPNQKLNKYSYSLGGEINLDRFHFTSNMSYTKRSTPNMSTNGYKSYDVMYNLLIYSPADYNILDYKDNYWMVKDQTQNWTYPNGNINNPYFTQYAITRSSDRDIFNADFSATYDITDWLKITARSGVDFFVDRGHINLSQGSWTSTGDSGVPGIDYPWNGTKVGAYITGRTQGFSINSDLLLRGDKKFVDDKLQLEYMAGGNIFYLKNDNLNGQTSGGISIPGFYSLKASVNAARVGESVQAKQSNSLFGRVGVSWDNLIFLDATARNDWISTLAGQGIPKSDWSYFYPSYAGSFVISELLPEGTKSWLDILKVRTSWTTAKAPPGIYEILPEFSVSTSIWDGLNGASAPETVRSTTIVPQKTNTLEYGLQTILFKNRVNFDVTHYNMTLSDYIMPINHPAPVTAASGIVGEVRNIDEVHSRKGWEVVLKGTPVKQQDLQLDVTFNWSTNKETYKEVDSLFTSNIDRDWVAAGKRVDYQTIIDFQYEPGTGALIWNNGLPLKKPGYSLFGYKKPDWEWGFQTNLRYKDFSLYLSFDGKVGGLINNITESYMWQAGVHPESVTETRAQDVATGDPHYIGDGVMVVSGSVDYDPSGNIIPGSDTRVFAKNDVTVFYQNAVRALHASSVWGGSPTAYDVYNATFFKLREISLTYHVPKSVLQSWGPVKSASISFVGQNVLFWAKQFKYSDPDGGNENFSDPSVRYLGGNIKLSF